jgi:hypothetical protein
MFTPILVLDEGEDGPARERLALLRRLDGGRGGVELPILLDVVAVGDGVEDAVLVAGREHDLVGSRAAPRGRHAQSGHDGGCDHEPKDPLAHSGPP